MSVKQPELFVPAWGDELFNAPKSSFAIPEEMRNHFMGFVDWLKSKVGDKLDGKFTNEYAKSISLKVAVLDRLGIQNAYSNVVLADELRVWNTNYGTLEDGNYVPIVQVYHTPVLEEEKRYLVRSYFDAIAQAKLVQGEGELKKAIIEILNNPSIGRLIQKLNTNPAEVFTN